MAEVSDLQLFGRFLQLVSALTAQEINFSRLGRELGLTPQTAQRWLNILKATFQWFEIPAYSGNLIKRVSSKSKGYIADTGLACLTQAISAPKAIGGHPLWGAIFETAVAAELRKQTAFLSPTPNFYHWRAHSGAEVDMVLEYNGNFYPIEVKAKTNPSRRDTTGISAFARDIRSLILPGGWLLPHAQMLYNCPKMTMRRLGTCYREGVRATFDCCRCGWGLGHHKNLKKLEKLIPYCIVGILNFLLKY